MILALYVTNSKQGRSQKPVRREKTMQRAKIIGLVIETGEEGLLHATSPDMRELFVSARSVEELKRTVPAVIEAIYDAHGEAVRVLEADGARGAAQDASPWVVVPKVATELAC